MIFYQGVINAYIGMTETLVWLRHSSKNTRIITNTFVKIGWKFSAQASRTPIPSKAEDQITFQSANCSLFPSRRLHAPYAGLPEIATMMTLNDTGAWFLDSLSHACQHLPILCVASTTSRAFVSHYAWVQTLTHLPHLPTSNLAL